MLFSDMQAGHYYGGWDGPPPAGQKAWLYVQGASSIGGRRDLDVCIIVRRSGSKWSGAMLVSGADSDTFPNVKRDATRAEILAERLPAAPGDTGGTVGAVPSAAPQAPTPGALHTMASTPVARADGKAVIPENNGRPTCLKCSGATKRIFLFQSEANYCPKCEP